MCVGLLQWLRPEITDQSSAAFLPSSPTSPRYQGNHWAQNKYWVKAGHDENTVLLPHDSKMENAPDWMWAVAREMWPAVCMPQDSPGRIGRCRSVWQSYWGRLEGVLPKINHGGEEGCWRHWKDLQTNSFYSMPYSQLGPNVKNKHRAWQTVGNPTALWGSCPIP